MGGVAGKFDHDENSVAELDIDFGFDLRICQCKKYDCKPCTEW